MTNEDLDLDLDENDNEEIISRKDKRISQLSTKFATSEEEKTKLAEEKAQAEAKAAEAEKERDFFKGFTQVSTKYQGAAEYQDQIWEKVKSGYDMEDATVAILAKEGKFQNQPQAQTRESFAGGSAVTAMGGSEDKTAKDMSQDELRSTLLEMEAKGELKL